MRENASGSVGTLDATLPFAPRARAHLCRSLAGDVERPLPRDEDAEEFRLMRGQPMPSLEEIQRPSERPSERPRGPGAQHAAQHRPRGHNPDR